MDQDQITLRNKRKELNEKNLNEQREILEKEAEYAAYGKQVLKNPAYLAAMTARKADIFDIFTRTKPDQAELREEAYRTMQNLLAFEKYIQSFCETGKMANETLKSLQKE